MKFKKLNYNKKSYFLYGLVVEVLLLLPLVLSITFGKYQTRESIKLVEGNISYKPYDFKIMAMYLENDNGEYEEIETMPTGNYIINEEKSYCTLDNINKDNNAILKTNSYGEHIINNLSKNDKCYLYFDIYTAKDIILANKIISTRNDFSTTLTTDTTGTIFTAADDDGTSYYYAGAPVDNWVKFAGFYWRIIRINGDGTIRMIYQGDSANTAGTETQTTTSAFNSNPNNNMYVGYMYTSESVHGTNTASTIKGILDSWYSSNLSGYVSYIATGSGATFCNDRQPSTSETSINNSGGTGTTTTYYAGYIRLATNKAPTFKCADSKDRFSTNIGLITADEVSYAGGVSGIENSIYYLYTGQSYWTMSPLLYHGGHARVFFVNSLGTFGSTNLAVDWAAGVRPVINLKADTTFSSGDGTSTNPYVVS